MWWGSSWWPQAFFLWWGLGLVLAEVSGPTDQEKHSSNRSVPDKRDAASGVRAQGGARGVGDRTGWREWSLCSGDLTPNVLVGVTQGVGIV